MGSRDRTLVIGLLVGALAVWVVLLVVMSALYPDAAEIRLAVASGIGVAVGLTAAPLAWLAAFGRRERRTRPGDWIRAVRRGVLAGALAAFRATLQLTGTTSLPIAAFAILLVVSLELVLSYRR